MSTHRFSEDQIEPLKAALADLTNSAMVERFVIVATTLDADASQSVSIFSTCEHAWQVLGLLEHAHQVTARDKYGSD